MRISIIGNCASGKSTLARAISRHCDIPHLHLDRLWFEAGGHTLTKNDTEGREKVRAYILREVEECIKQNDWVSDGWYSRVQPLIAERADVVVYIDIPLGRRLLNHVRRIFMTERHPELSRWKDLLFSIEIVRRTFTHGVQMRAYVHDYPEKVIHLRSYREVDAYMASLGCP